MAQQESYTVDDEQSMILLGFLTFINPPLEEVDEVLPQILLNNFLYDLSQVTIPTDNVDTSYIMKPCRWDIKLIRDFMIYIGPVSSIFDFLTFFIMLQVFHASAALFHTGWFVESLATQTLVLFIIRTTGNPLRSRPSLPLSITVLLIVAFGMLLPFTSLAGTLGFTPLPALYFLFLAGMIITYFMLVEVMKRWLMQRPVKGGGKRSG